MDLVKSKDIIRFKQLVDKAPSAMPVVKPSQVPNRARLLGRKGVTPEEVEQTLGGTMMRGKSTVHDTGAGGRANPQLRQGGFIVQHGNRQPVEIAGTEGHEKQHAVFSDIAAKYHPVIAMRIGNKIGEALWPLIDAHPVSRSLYQTADRETTSKMRSKYEEFLAYMHNYLNDPYFRHNLHAVTGMDEMQGREAYKHMAKIHAAAHAISQKVSEKDIDPKYIPKTTQAPTGR